MLVDDEDRTGRHGEAQVGEFLEDHAVGADGLVLVVREQRKRQVLLLLNSPSENGESTLMPYTVAWRFE